MTSIIQEGYGRVFNRPDLGPQFYCKKNRFTWLFGTSWKTCYSRFRWFHRPQFWSQQCGTYEYHSHTLQKTKPPGTSSHYFRQILPASSIPALVYALFSRRFWITLVATYLPQQVRGWVLQPILPHQSYNIHLIYKVGSRKPLSHAIYSIPSPWWFL